MINLIIESLYGSSDSFECQRSTVTRWSSQQMFSMGGFANKRVDTSIDNIDMVSGQDVTRQSMRFPNIETVQFTCA